MPVKDDEHLELRSGHHSLHVDSCAAIKPAGSRKPEVISF